MFSKFKQMHEDAKLGNLIRRITNGGESVTMRPAPIMGPDPIAKIAVVIKNGNNAMIESLLNEPQELCKFYYPAKCGNSDSHAMHTDIKEVKMLTVEDAARTADVTVATIERLCESGRLTTYICTPHGRKEPVKYVDFIDLELLLMDEAWECGI